MKHLSFVLLFVSASSFASDFETTVDCADSGDFSCLHEDGRIEQEKHEKQKKRVSGNKADLFNQAVDNKYDAQDQLKQKSEHQVGAVYNVRVRYSLDANAGGYTAATVVNPLHKLMAKYCEKGWTKLREWSEQIEGSDYYLHYQFQCANR
ncbi:MAG: hypothetical protein K6L73_07090 [Cellvibrionaceae bacterium]